MFQLHKALCSGGNFNTHRMEHIAHVAMQDVVAISNECNFKSGQGEHHMCAHPLDKENLQILMEAVDSAADSKARSSLMAQLVSMYHKQLTHGS